MFADINFEARFEDQMFGGPWDNLPVLGLEQPGQAVGPPPPVPQLYPQAQQFQVLPHRAPQPAANSPVQAGAQAGYAQNQAPAIPAVPAAPAQQNIPPQAWQWNMGPFGPGVAVGGAPAFADLPRQSPRAANPGNQAQLAPMVFNNQPVVDHAQRLREVQDRIVNLQQGVNNIQPQRAGNMGPNEYAQEQQRQIEQRVRNLRHQHMAFDAIIPLEAQQGIAMARDAAQMPGVAGRRIPRHAGRGAARLKPPNGQA